MRWALALTFVFAAQMGSADVARPETVLDTLDLLAGAVTQADGVAGFEINRQDRSLVVLDAEGKAMTIFPDNIHAQLQNAANDAERQTLLDGFVEAISSSMLIAQLPDTMSTDLILAVVRPRDFGADFGDEGPVPVSEPFIGDLGVFYVFDFPTTLRNVTADDLDALGINEAALPGLATENFRLRGWSSRVEGDGLYMLVLDGNFEATTLLDAALWNRIDEQLGRVIMAPIARDLIVFTDADWEGAPETLFKTIAEAGPMVSHPLSELVFEWRNGAWVDYPAP